MKILVIISVFSIGILMQAAIFAQDLPVSLNNTLPDNAANNSLIKLNLSLMLMRDLISAGFDCLNRGPRLCSRASINFSLNELVSIVKRSAFTVSPFVSKGLSTSFKVWTGGPGEKISGRKGLASVSKGALTSSIL